MPLRLEFTQEAKRNLSDMFWYGASHWGAKHAQSYLNKLESEIRLLCQQPEMGKSMEKFRTLPIDQYLIIYDFNKERVLIHSIRPRGRTR